MVVTPSFIPFPSVWPGPMTCTTTSPGTGPVGKRKQVKKHTEALELIRKLTELDC